MNTFDFPYLHYATLKTMGDLLFIYFPHSSKSLQEDLPIHTPPKPPPTPNPYDLVPFSTDLGSLPLHPSGFGWVGSQFIKAQWKSFGWEFWVTEQPPLVQTLRPQSLIILVEVLVGIGVGTEASRPSSLLSQSWCHSRHVFLLFADPNDGVNAWIKKWDRKPSLRKFVGSPPTNVGWSFISCHCCTLPLYNNTIYHKYICNSPITRRSLSS